MPGSIPPQTWGPFFWHTMHLVALGYSNQPSYAEKKAAKEFYESLVHLIPCPTCKLHYADNLKVLPISPSLDNRRDLFKWTVDMHNLVNKQLGKREYTEAESIAFYYKLGAMGRSPVWTPEDIQSMYFSKLAKYGGAAIAVAAVAGVVWYLLPSKE
jgi:hypothetical protein